MFNKKIIAALLALIMVISMPVFASADDDSGWEDPPTYQFEAEAEGLFRLGLFKGTDNGFELGAVPTRIQAGVMLIRLLGKEAAALSCTATHPFTDVPQWADRYVAFLYENKIANGVDYTLFGTDNPCEAKMFVTFVLRALDYSDAAGDFTYTDSLDFAKGISLLSGIYALELKGREFLRDDMVGISYDALLMPVKAFDKKLIERLLAEGAVDKTLGETFYYASIMDEIGMENDFAIFAHGGFDSVYENSYKVSADGEYAPVNINCKINMSYNIDPAGIIASAIYSLPQGGMEYTVYLPGDGYRYLDFKDGEKIKEKLPEEDDAPTKDDIYYEKLLDFDKYEKISVTKQGEDTVIELVYTADGALLDMRDEIEYYFGKDGYRNFEVRNLAMFQSCTEKLVINKDGLILSDTDYIDFYFTPVSEEMIFRITSATEEKFSNFGKKDLKFPSFDDYILSEE